MFSPIWKYISAEKTSTGQLKFDHDAVEKLKEEYEVAGQEQGIILDLDNDFELDEGVLKRLIDNLRLIDDQFTRSCIESWIFSTPNKLQEEVEKKLAKVNEVQQNVKIEIPTGFPTATTTSGAQAAPAGPASMQKHIFCILHRKSAKREVEEFFSNFLFRQIRGDPT